MKADHGKRDHGWGHPLSNQEPLSSQLPTWAQQSHLLTQYRVAFGMPAAKGLSKHLISGKLVLERLYHRMSWVVHISRGSHWPSQPEHPMSRSPALPATT